MALEPCLRIALLARYSLGVGLIAPLLVPLAAYLAPELLGSLLVLEDPQQLFHVTWLSLLLATFVLVSFRVIETNAPARFADYRASLGWQQPDDGDSEKFDGLSRQTVAAGSPGWRWRWPLLLLLGWSLPLWCVVRTAGDPSPQWPDSTPSLLFLAGLVVLGGTLVAIVLLLLLTAAQQLLLDPAVVSADLLPFENWGWFAKLKQIHVPWLNFAERRIAQVLRHLGPGYTQRRNRSGEVMLAPGHAQLALWVAIIMAFYLYSFLGIHSRQRVPSEHGSLCALFFLLLVLLFIHLVLAGVAFLLDYYRIPVSVVLVALSFISARLFDSDHVYELNPGAESLQTAADSQPPSRSLELQYVFDDWPFPQRTLVMVSAAGGGIQSSAWTARVLTGLDELYGAEFTRSIGVVSGVSGGSIGTMFYLVGGNWAGTDPPFDDRARQKVNRHASASSLEAAAWGMAYPDLIRTFAPFLVKQNVDRGWAMERAWESYIGHPTLAEWGRRISEDHMPVAVFNATLAETGQRLLISPVLEKPGAAATASDAYEFFNLYARDIANPRVATAARLSATFPYVSPICRPDDATLRAGVQYHVADGGYAENGGIFTVLEWAKVLAARYREERSRRFDRIVIVRILPFQASDRPPPAKANRGWTYEVWGPIDTISSVRTASQTERNNFDEQLLTAPADARTRQVGPIPIVVATFEFRSSANYVAPLSWHLTTSQKNVITETWRAMVRDNPPQSGAKAASGDNDQPSGFEVLDHFFRRSSPP